MMQLGDDGWPDIEAMDAEEFLQYSNQFAAVSRRKLDDGSFLLTTEERGGIEKALSQLNFALEMCALELELQTTPAAQ